MKKIITMLLAMSFLFFLMPQISFADKGDFYERHKGEIDKFDLSESYVDAIKAYDSDTNDFECGSLEITCKMLSFQLGWSTGLANFVADGTEMLVLNPEMITQDNGFVKYKNYLQGLSSSMLILFLIWQIMVMVMRRYGDPDDYGQAFNQKLLGVFAGAVMLGLYEPIFDLILSVQHDITSAILSSGVDKEQLVLMMFLYTPQYSILFTIFIGLIQIVFLIALVYRFVALGFFYVVGPIAIPTLINDEFNYFQLWLKYIVNNIVTLFMQSLAFALSIAAFTGQFTFTKSLPAGIDVVAGFLLSIVLCFFALVVPSILGNLGSSTGTGRMLGRVARYAVTRR